MSRPTRATTDGRAYLDLQNMARRDGRPTDELLQLYALEGFLDRLARSGHADRLVLKGGVLLAAFGNRRATRDADFAAMQLANDTDTILGLIREVAHMDVDDGLRYAPDSATAEIIRDEDEYSGTRVNLDAVLHRARLRFHVDVNVGDPIWPGPRIVHVPRLLGGQAVALTGYPLHMVHAEKIVTAVQRGTASTRWRDFGDIWTLSGSHATNGSDLVNAIVEVADHRRASLLPLAQVLDGYALLSQRRYAVWRRKQDLDQLPDQFADVIADVIAFADPPITGSAAGQVWNPVHRAWQ